MSTDTPIHIQSSEEWGDEEYMLKLAAEVIRQTAPNIRVFDELALHYSHDESDENCSGTEFAARLDEYANRLKSHRLVLESSPTIRGHVVQAGGIPDATITISTHTEDLRGNPIPLYRKFRIQFLPP